MMLPNNHYFINFLKLFYSLLIFSNLSAIDLDYNAAISSSYGDNYDFYSYSENRLDLNLFFNDLHAWVQYEYSNPPELGFPINDFRKFGIEYAKNNYLIKIGDIYEFWGRGLVLNQIDDQSTNFDNGTRGIFLGYSNGRLSFSHINGKGDIWISGPARLPMSQNSHSITANMVQFDLNSAYLGLTHFHSNELHEFSNGDTYINHSLYGIHGFWAIQNIDMSFEYVDKKSMEKSLSLGVNPHEPLKNGYGFYGNINFYIGGWGLSTEYKRYSFDKSETFFTSDDYGNRISFQLMPTLVREQNFSLLNRVAHQYNYNDERGFQLELNGALPLGYTIVSQYSHLSRNNEWNVINTPTDWSDQKIDNILPSSKESSLPYYESYNEISGYHLNDKLFFRLGYANNKEINELFRYFDGYQIDNTSFWEYDTTIDSSFAEFDYYPEIIDSTFIESYSDPYRVESQSWQESKSITIPLELTYSFDNGYSIGITYEYQERKKMNISKGNSDSFNYSDSTWSMINPDNYDEYFEDNQSQIRDGRKKQFNRLISLTLSKANTWSFSLSHDHTNAFIGGVQKDTYYNPIEALVYGDIKYFTGNRERGELPSFIQRRWLSMELSYNIGSSQRVSIMYGSIQGGLFCSNGVCRQIAPFNDGIKISYSAIF